MHLNLRLILYAGIFLMLSACNFPTRVTAQITPEPILVVTPQKTETSVFDAVVTPSPTPPPTSPVPTQPEPTPGLIPGLQVSPLVQGLPVNISAVDMLDAQVGWAQWDAPDYGLSGFLLRTLDGGQTWGEVTPPSGYPIGSRFYALDAQHAWAAPAMVAQGTEVKVGYIWHTSDGGQSWQPSASLILQMQGEPALMENFLPQGLFFLDEQQGWAVVSVGHYMNQDVLVIYATQDGGQTWTDLADKFTMGQGEGRDGGAGMPCRVTGIAFLDSQHGYLAGDCIAVSMDNGWSILVTGDGGRTWQEQMLPEPSGVPQILKQAENTPERICAPTGVEVTPAGVLIQHTCLLPRADGAQQSYFFLSLSSDRGQTWTGWQGETASFTDLKTGWSLSDLQQDGTRMLSSTTDGGSTWHNVRQVTWPGARLDFAAPEMGYALAWEWSPSRQNFDYALVSTTNGGDSWQLVKGLVK